MVPTSLNRTPKSLWKSPQRIYLNAKGKPVPANDPTRVSLLVAEGGVLPIERARELGLLDIFDEAGVADSTGDADDTATEAADSADAKAQEQADDKALRPGRNKAVNGPQETK